MTPPTKRARSDDEEHDQARSDDKQPPRAVMISYRVETEDRQLVDFWGEPWGPPQLVLLSDVKKYASLIYDMAEATEWHLFLDVSRDTSYDDDQPEDDTAVPTYHEHDSRNIDLVAKTLQGEDNSEIRDNNEIREDLAELAKNVLDNPQGKPVKVVGRIVVNEIYDEEYWGY